MARKAPPAKRKTSKRNAPPARKAPPAPMARRRPKPKIPPLGGGMMGLGGPGASGMMP
jgi:hypothetical protein